MQAWFLYSKFQNSKFQDSKFMFFVFSLAFLFKNHACKLWTVDGNKSCVWNQTIAAPGG